jgi:para-aminobenzoate synthetase component 1
MVEKQISNDAVLAKDQMNALGEASRPFLFILDYAMAHPRVIPLDEVDPGKVLYQVNGKSNLNVPSLPVESPVALQKEPVAFEVYQAAFEQVMAELAYGNSFLCNLTFRTPIKLNLSLNDIFRLSAAKYKLCFPDEFVLFSPETFVRIQDERILTYPMKGTIDAQLPDARRRILDDPKERAEHITIVDLLRNDLSQVAADVRVDRFRYIEEVRTHDKTLLQVSSEISGDPGATWKSRMGDILFTLLPAGSISGAPKKKTVEILRKVEAHPRGYFSGVFGLFDGAQLDSGVMIRFIEREGDQLFFRSGGGITTQSNVQDEYQEMLDKIYVPIY